MESTQPLSITGNTINLQAPWTNLLQNNTVLLEFMGELMDSGLSVDRKSLSSGNIVVTCGNPEKVCSVIRKIIYEVDVPTEGGDEYISKIPNSLTKDLSGQFETILDQSCSTFKLVFHRKIKADLKLVIQEQAIKRCFLLLSPQQVNYLQRHLDYLQENVKNGKFQGEINLKVQKDFSGKDAVLISSKWSEFKAVKLFAEQLISTLQHRHEKLEPSRALFLSSVKGQQELRQLEEDDNCSVSVVLPGHQLLMKAVSPKGHCLYLCRGNMAVSDCSVLVLPFLGGEREWTPEHRLILERALLTTKTEFYAELIGCSPKPRTVTLHSQRPDGGRTIVLAHVPNHPDSCSAVTEGLEEALRLPCTRGRSVALPVRMSARHSLPKIIKSILPVLRQIVDQDESLNTLVFYMESPSSAAEERNLTETLQEMLNPHWKVEVDAVALQEEKEPATPEAIICGQHQDLEKASNELLKIRVSSEYEERAVMLNSGIKPEPGSELSVLPHRFLADRETGVPPRKPGEEHSCDDKNPDVHDSGDLRQPQQTCSEAHVGGGALSGHGAPHCKAVLVQNLNPITVDDTVRYFFSNKRRSHGGAVSFVTRLDSSRVLVGFENYQHAQAVVDKGCHILDGFTLAVSLHLECFSPATITTLGQESGPEMLVDRTLPLTSKFVRPGLREQRGVHHRRSKEDLRQVGLHLQPSELSHQPKAGRSQSGDSAVSDSGRSRRGKSKRGFKSGFHTVNGRRHAQSGHIFGHESIPPQYPLPPPACCFTTAEFSDPNALESSLPSKKHSPDVFDKKRHVANPRLSLTPQDLPPKQVVVKLGLIGFDKLQKDKEIRQRFKRELTEIDARWEWSPPESIVVSATKSDLPEDWRDQVWKRTDRYKHLLQYKFVEEVNRVQTDRELRAGQALTEQVFESDLRSRGENSRILTPCGHGVDTQNGGQADDKTAEQEEKVLHVDYIRHLTSSQIKFLSLPHAEIKFEEKYRGLSLHVDRDNSRLALRCAATDKAVKTMKAEVMDYLLQISEIQLPATEAMAKLFSDTRSISCIDAMLKKKGVVCRLELESNCISVSAPTLQLVQQAEDILQRSFKEDSIVLNEENMAATKSAGWQTLVEKIRRRAKEGTPPPVLVLNTEKKMVTLVDFVENFPRSLADIKTFFSVTKMETRTLKMSLNHCKFLKKCCKVYLKELEEKASKCGVSFEITKGGRVDFTGFREELDAMETTIKSFLQNIQIEQKSFSGPGVATYLTSSRGQEFLEQTGQANGCLITFYSPKCGGPAVTQHISGRGEELSRDEGTNVCFDAFLVKDQPDREKDLAAPEPDDCGSSSSRKLPVTWKAIAVVVYSKETEAIGRVMEIIHNHIDKNQTSKREEETLICNFSSQQLSAVTELQKKCEVAIEIDIQQGFVQITGFEINVLKAVAAIKDIKSDAIEHDFITAMAPVLWQYEVDSDRYRNFHPKLIQDIEAAYNRKDPFVTLTDRKGRKYKIVFEENKEYSLDADAKPVSVRRIDVSQGNTEGREKTEGFPLPRHWEPMMEARVKLVDLDPFSNEYKDVLQNFGSQAVRKIQRVQNPTLYQQYKVKKKELAMHNPQGIENEMRLWHGTDSKNTDSIITNGFNRSFSGQNGTAYGQGVYFATDSALSRRYARGGQMFQVRVLVGESTPGHSSMRMPPNKPGSQRPYDSLSGPGMFVIFHDTQAYPEYLVTT